MVPSTYEAGKLYNVLPSGNRAPDSTGENSGYDQTRADFDFDRGSNAAATRVNADGLIEKYRENLFTQSNNLTHSDWDDGSNTSISSGFEDKDGGTNAFRLTMTSGIGTYFYQSKSVTNGGVYTFSFWAKANGSTHLYTSGDVGFTSVPLTNEWQRFEFYFVSSTSTPSVGLDNNAAAVDCLVMNMQLETGMVATEYLESTSVTGKAGVLIDLPRIDYSSGAGALLLEPSRQQLFPHSEYFDTWNSDLSEVRTPNSIVSPEGVLNGYTLAANNGGSALNIYDAISVTSGADYVFSVWLKKKTTNEIQLYMYSTSAPVGFVSRAEVDFDAGTITNLDGSGATIEPYKNGWFRCSVKCTAPAAGLSNGIYNTDGGADVYAYGAQLEAGSYSTSYIPNHGESGGVTRAADSCSVTGASDVIGQTEGTLFAEFESDDSDGSQSERIIAVSNGSSQNRVIVIYSGSGWRFIMTSGSTTNCDTTIAASSVPTTLSGRHKLAMTYSASEVRCFIDGYKGNTDPNVVLPTSLSAVYIGKNEGGVSSNLYSGGIKQAIVFNEALTDAECITLTTL